MEYLPTRRRQRLADRRDGLVGVAGGRGEGAQDALDARPLGAQRHDVLQLDHAGGERPGLVGAQHVDVAQRLDGVEALHEDVLPQQAHRPQSIGEGDREDESVGDERQDDGAHPHALDEGDPSGDVAHPHEDLEDHDHEQQGAHDLRDLQLERGQLALEGGGLRHELVGETRQADLLGLVVAATGHAEAAREQRVAVVLDDQVRLAGEQGLVDLHAACAEHGAVDHDLVAWVQVEEVAEHDLGWVEVAQFAVAQHRRLGPHEDGDAVHHALGADLLDEADHRVGGDHGDDDEGVERLPQDEQQDAHDVEEVVDEVEDVVADDAPVGAPGVDLRVVALAGGAPPRRLLGGETGGRRGRLAAGRRGTHVGLIARFGVSTLLPRMRVAARYQGGSSRSTVPRSRSASRSAARRRMVETGVSGKGGPRPRRGDTMEEMFDRLARLRDPALYQGGDTERGYFEGWYFKAVDGEGGHAVAVIPGVSFSADATRLAGVRADHPRGWQHAFLLVSGGRLQLRPAAALLHLRRRQHVHGARDGPGPP